MITLVVKDCPPWDGRYEMQEDWRFTNEELYRIKVISRGIRASELLEAIDANDTAAFVGLGVVVLARYGHAVDPTDFWNAPVGSLDLDLSELQVDPTPLADADAPSENTNGSGTPSGPDGESPASDPSPTGSRSSATVADSDRVTSAR